MKRTKKKRAPIGGLRFLLTIFFALIVIFSILISFVEKYGFIILFIGIIGLFAIWYPYIRESKKSKADYDFTEYNRSLSSRDNEDNYF